MDLKLHGGAIVYLDGVEQQPVVYAGVTGVTVMEVNLSQPTAQKTASMSSCWMHRRCRSSAGSAARSTRSRSSSRVDARALAPDDS